MRVREFVSVGVALLALAIGSPAFAIGVTCISNNNAGDCAVGEAQFSVDVSDAGGGLVLFTFNNAGPAVSSIADVYFDDGVLRTIESIINSPGVSFSEGATPPNLPAAGNVSPAFDATFSADSDAPVEANGVNPGETLGIRFALQPGASFADVLAAIADGSLRIGIHAQALPSGGSESFVNRTVSEPDALALFAGAAALTGLGSWRWRGLRRSR
jgi:hypothetical protein